MSAADEVKRLQEIRKAELELARARERALKAAQEAAERARAELAKAERRIEGKKG